MGISLDKIVALKELWSRYVIIIEKKSNDISKIIHRPLRKTEKKGLETGDKLPNRSIVTCKHCGRLTRRIRFDKLEKFRLHSSGCTFVKYVAHIKLKHTRCSN